MAGFRPDLKWPNDLLVGSRKLAGVLAEAVPGAVVLGMGLNVAWPPEPTDLAISASSVAGRPVGRDDLLDAYLDHLAGRLQQWEHDPAALHADYRAALATLGRAVRVELAGGDDRGHRRRRRRRRPARGGERRRAAPRECR